MSKTYEIGIRVKLLDNDSAEIGIGSFDGDPNSIPPKAWMVAIEHLMTMWAIKSDAGFERAIELLVEGARSNKVKMFDGSRTDH